MKAKHWRKRLKRLTLGSLLALTALSGTVWADAQNGHGSGDHEGAYGNWKHDEAYANWNVEYAHGNGDRQDDNGQYPYHNIDVKLLGINDFHGQLDVTRKVAGKDVGGADYLAAYLKKHGAGNKNTLLVHAGDLVGASAPTSALLQDEPSVTMTNMLGFDVGTVGNHEFDKGVKEMQRMVHGGVNQTTGKYFEGADYPYVCANVVDKKTGKTILPPYTIKKVNGVPIGFIGVVLSDTPSIVMPSGVESVLFTDETEAINKAAAELKKKGVHAIVVLAHNPGSSKTEGTAAEGEVVDIAQRTDSEVDVILGGHSHQYLNATVGGKLVVQAYSYGTAFSDIDLQIDPRTKDIVSKKAQIVTTYHDGIVPDAEIGQLVNDAQAKVGPIVKRVVGTSANQLTASQNAAGESALGNLIADAQRAAMKTDFAFMNPGGIRADVAQGQVTWGALYTVQPFGNTLTKMTLTGSQIRTMLNQQWQPDKTRMLQISGLSYAWDNRRPIGNKVTDITLPGGAKLHDAAVYTVTVNSFLADGGDNFSGLKDGGNRETGPSDLDALVDYVSALPQPFSASVEGRIKQVQ